MDLKVEKRDGSLEPFDRSKIILGLANAGVLVSEANQIADQIEQWAPTAAQEEAIKSTAIRDKILELLNEQDSDAASEFESYKKEE